MNQNDRASTPATDTTRQITRRDLLQRALATGGAVGLTAAAPGLAAAGEPQRGAAPAPAAAAAPTPISRQFAKWVVGLRYEDLPPAVVDRAKGLLLQNISSALLGSQLPAAQDAIKLVTQEESGVRTGATVLVTGTKVTKGGAGFANSEMMLAGGKWDTFRMLVHAGTAIVPGALIAAEESGCSGKDLITGLVAGYEVTERMAADWIPHMMARGFHAGPTFSIFGTAIAAAKILKCTEEQVHQVISLCTCMAGSNLESRALREGAAVRNAMLAVSLARENNVNGGEYVLEGPAGFYYAYAGNNEGYLTFSFTGETRTSLDKLTVGLGKEWFFLETLYRIYSTAGYNIAHVDVTAKLCEENNIKYADIDRMEAVVNWNEVVYNPGFPRAEEPARAGSTHYFMAYGAAMRSFPLLKGSVKGDAIGSNPPPEVADLMKRVTIIPSHKMTLFGPRFTIWTKDGKSYTKQSTGREFMWDFNEEVRRIRPIGPALVIPAAQYDELIEACRTLETQPRADKLIQLTVKKA